VIAALALIAYIVTKLKGRQTDDEETRALLEKNMPQQKISMLQY